MLQRGWTVAVLDLLESSGTADRRGLPEGVAYEVAADVEEQALVEALGTVRSHLGDIGACIIVAPREGPADGALDLGRQNGSTGRAILRAAFLIAKELQPSLARAARFGNATFITVTAIDGELGFSGRSGRAALGGLAGLTKTLRLEWPEVFCRAVDLDPALDAGRGADLILGELLDPNRLIAEVGHGPRGRVTLVAEPSRQSRSEPDGLAEGDGW
jgi:NAD(P)-dependent dehydrogenase (short-subunit alcohol dehydrogenase family)